MTSNYFPGELNGRGPNPWVTKAQFPGARQGSRLGPVSSGSSRNMNRGYTGGMDGQGMLGPVSNTLIHQLPNYIYYKSLTDHVDKDLGTLHNDLQSLKGSNAPALPSVDEMMKVPRRKPSERMTHDDGSPLGLPAGPRPMGRRASGNPALPAGDGPRLALPAAGQTSAPRVMLDNTPALGAGPSQLALPAAGQTTNARTGLPDARPHPFTGPLPPSFGAGFSARLQKGGTPDARLGVGPSIEGPEAPSARQKGRRAPAGMDSRKRGTWLNFQ